MARFVLVAVLFLAALSAVMAMKQKTVPPPTTTPRPTTHLSMDNRPREEYQLNVRDTCGKIKLQLRCTPEGKHKFPLNSVYQEVVSTSVRTNGHNKLKIRLDKVNRPNTKRPDNGAAQRAV